MLLEVSIIVDVQMLTLMDSLKFDTDKAELSERVQEELAEIYTILSSNPTVSVVVEGHADETGSEGYNQKLSKKERLRSRVFNSAGSFC